MTLLDGEVEKRAFTAAKGAKILSQPFLTLLHLA